MQITPLKPNALRSEAAAAAGAVATASDKAGAAPAAAAAAPLGGGLRNWAPGLNQEISNAQRVLRYLDESQSQLQALKADISSRLSARQGSDGKLESKIRQFAELWKDRQQASGGSLDSTLVYRRAEKSRQSFTIAGLDLRSLQSGAKEKLDFAAAGQAVSVVLEPGLSAEDVARRMDQALAPLNVRAQLDAGGKLSFNTPEELWPDLSKSLTVKGNGIRVAAGKMHRVKAEPQPAAVRPEEWRADGQVEMRRTLQEVVNTLDWISRARQSVNQALTEMQRALSSGQPEADAQWAQAFAKDFEALAQQSHYQLSFSVAPALSSVNRTRVQALLALK